MKWVIKFLVYLVCYIIVHLVADWRFSNNSERTRIGNAVAWGFCAGTIVEAVIWAFMN